MAVARTEPIEGLGGDLASPRVSKAFVVFEKQYLVPPLLRGRAAELRPAFRPLLGDPAAAPLPVARRGDPRAPSPVPFVRHAGAAAIPSRPPLDLGAPSSVIASSLPAAAEAVPAITHNPLRVVARRRVDTQLWPYDAIGVDAQVRDAPVGLRTRARAYANLYPYGLLTCQLTVALSFNVERGHDLEVPTGPGAWVPVRTLIRILALLAGRGEEDEVADYYLDRAGGGEAVIAGRAEEFLDRLAVEGVRSVLEQATDAGLVEGERSRVVAALANPPIAAMDGEVAGLLMLEPDYERLSPGVVKRASLFGKDVDDLVAANSGAMVISANESRMHPASFRRYTWNLVEILSAVRGTKLVLSRLAADAPRPGESPDGLTAAAAAALVRGTAITRYLAELPQQLPRHHRKWYRQCYKLLGVAGKAAEVQRAHERWQDDERIRELARRVEEAAMTDRIHVEISGGQIGALGIGSVVHDIEGHLTLIQGEEAVEVRAGFKELAEAIGRDEALPADAKKELLDYVELLSGEAAKPPEQRKTSAVKSFMASLKEGLGVAATAGSVLATWAPTIAKFFGL